jgi:RHS repeat-associated protein
LRITDENKNIVAGYTYDPWGNILSSSGSFADQQPFRYAGYLFDEETGLYFLQARYYDPTLGRFISRDPDDAGDITLSINPYVYAEGNPLSFVDPTGNAIELTGHPKNAPHLVKRLRLGLANMGYTVAGLDNDYTKNTWDKKLAKAVKQFKRTHLGWKNGKTYPLSKLYGNDGHVNNAVWDVFEYWHARREQRNDFFSLHGRVSPKKKVAVYAVMDKAWNHHFNSAGLADANAAGKQAIRRRFSTVNKDFPGGIKLRPYDIETLDTMGGNTMSKRLDWLVSDKGVNWNSDRRMGRSSRFWGYEVLVGFTSLYDYSGKNGSRIAGRAKQFPVDAALVTYLGSARNEAATLAHEIGHLYGQEHHEDPKTANGCGNSSSANSKYGSKKTCMMASIWVSSWPGWCPHHQEKIAAQADKW